MREVKISMEIREKVYDLIKVAIDSHTSDIFILPKKDLMVISFRKEAGLEVCEKYPSDQGREIINFFKYAAQMDISEHRRPQVGAMVFEYQGQEYYLRLSSLGDFNDQESLVIRIIYQTSTSNYFFPEQLQKLKSLAKKRGLILTSGPTGSGKTTTMYELAKDLGKDKVVMTIEDPVEVHEEKFFQTQVNVDAEIDYVSLLKAALRHRPDILIVGEIRDQGTARLAVDAALSGHLVFATVHAKSTIQTISRLEGLGITREELLNCLTAVSYQRLIPAANGHLSCLVDIASEKQLLAEIQDELRGDFIAWKENLNKLHLEEMIDDEIFELYQEG